MAWLIRSKGRAIHLRDGSGPGDPLYDLSGGKWWPFETLPPGLHNGGDGDVDVMEVESNSGREKAPLLNKHVPVAADPPSLSAETHPEPPKRKPKFR